MNARDHLDQRRLAGAIVADQRHHFPRMKIKREVLNCGDTAEGFADILELQNGVHDVALRKWGQGSGWPKMFSIETTRGLPVETPAMPTE